MAEEKNQFKELVKALVIPLIALLTGIGTNMMWLEWLASVVGIITVIPFLVEAVKVALNLSGKKWWFMSASRWLTFLFSFILVYLSYYLDFGLKLWLLELGIPLLGSLQLVVVSLIIGLTANGWFKVEWIEWALAVIFNREEKQARIIAIKEIQSRK